MTLGEWGNCGQQSLEEMEMLFTPLAEQPTTTAASMSL